MPELTLGWRLKMALGDMKRDEMADALGINPATVSRWCADKGAPPKRAYLLQWALITETDPNWLEHGFGSASSPTPPRPGKPDPEALAALVAEKSARNRRGNTAGYLRFTPEFDHAA